MADGDLQMYIVYGSAIPWISSNDPHGGIAFMKHFEEAKLHESILNNSSCASKASCGTEHK